MLLLLIVLYCMVVDPFLTLSFFRAFVIFFWLPLSNTFDNLHINYDIYRESVRLKILVSFNRSQLLLLLSFFFHFHFHLLSFAYRSILIDYFFPVWFNFFRCCCCSFSLYEQPTIVYDDDLTRTLKSWIDFWWKKRDKGWKLGESEWKQILIFIHIESFTFLSLFFAFNCVSVND